MAEEKLLYTRTSMMRSRLQLKSAVTRLHTSALNCAAVMLEVCAWPVMIRRDASLTAVCMTWLVM